MVGMKWIKRKEEKEKEKEVDRTHEGERERPSSLAPSAAPGISRAPSDVRHRKHTKMPIIIVPSSLTALLTLHNAKQFLENGLFQPPLDVKNQGGKKEITVTVKRRKDKGATAAYQIVDNTTRFTHSDWERVVAVFAQGPAWQFKDWRWSDPVDLFTHVKGYFLQYDDAQLPASIKSWNVKILYVNRYRRHLDQTAVLDFWSTLDTALTRKKPNLVT